MNALTDKQRLFVAEYLVDLNATQAAIRAGYSPRSAEAIGFENLRKPKISEAIQEAVSARIERTEITADKVLKEYARLGFSRMDEFTSWGPDGVMWKDSDELSDDAAACVAEVSETISEGGRTRRFKLHSKTAALRDMAQHLQLLGKDGGGVHVSVNVDARRAEQEKKEEHFEQLFAKIDRYRAAADVANGRGDTLEPMDSSLSNS